MRKPFSEHTIWTTPTLDRALHWMGPLTLAYSFQPSRPQAITSCRVPWGTMDHTEGWMGLLVVGIRMMLLIYYSDEYDSCVSWVFTVFCLIVNNNYLLL